MLTTDQLDRNAIAAAPLSRFKGRKGIWGGTVRTEEAKVAWTKCRYYGNAFRIIDGRIYYATYGPPLVPSWPGANHGTYGDGYDLHVFDATDSLAKCVLVHSEHFSS